MYNRLALYTAYTSTIFVFRKSQKQILGIQKNAFSFPGVAIGDKQIVVNRDKKCVHVDLLEKCDTNFLTFTTKRNCLVTGIVSSGDDIRFPVRLN